MIEAIKEIGEYTLKKENKNVNAPLNILIEDPESNPKKPQYKWILLISVEKVDENYKYKGVDIEEYSKDKLNNYLYKQGSSNGPDITPTSRITRIKPEKGYLFSLEPDYKKYLVSGPVSGELKKVFNECGYPLSSKAEINRDDETKRFLIEDVDRELNIYERFLIEDVDRELNIYEKGKKSTFETKILPWFKEYAKQGLDEEINFLVNVGDCLRTDKEKIQRDLEVEYERFNKKEKAVLTLKIDGRYIGEYEIFKTILVEESKKGFYSRYGVTSKADNKICSVCNDKKDEVYGFVDTFKFYTVDKPGFVSSGFKQKDAWKNYPVCLNCALILEEGKTYLKNNLNFNFYGINYHLIPNLIFSSDYDDKKNIFGMIEDWGDPKFERKGIDRLTSDENEIFDLMSEQQNYLNMDFMFYDAPKGYDGSEFHILLYIEDIFPSRLKELFDSKKEIDKIDIFKDCMVPVFENKKRTGERPLEFNFGILHDFFYDYTNKKWIGKRYFLDVVNKIFTNRHIDYDFLLSFIMQRIRNDFINDTPTKISTLRGFMLLNYLNILGLIKLKGRTEMNNKEAEESWGIVKGDTSNEGEEISQKITSFFSRFGDFFDSDAKKATFLEGVLVQKLLNIQRLPEVSNAQPGKEPFRPRLKGLKLEERQVKKLLPEIQNKLEEYGKNYYRTLESIISKHFVSAGNGWKIPNDEISFYLVLGMNLSYIFKTKKESSNEGEKNE